MFTSTSQLSASVGLTLISFVAFAAAAPVHAIQQTSDKAVVQQRAERVTDTGKISKSPALELAFGNCPIYYGCTTPVPPVKGGGGGGGGGKGGEPQPKLMASGNCPIYYGCTTPVPPVKGGGGGGGKGGEPQPKLMASGNCPIYYGCTTPVPPVKGGGGGGGGKGGEPQAPKLRS